VAGSRARRGRDRLRDQDGGPPSRDALADHPIGVRRPQVDLPSDREAEDELPAPGSAPRRLRPRRPDRHAGDVAHPGPAGVRDDLLGDRTGRVAGGVRSVGLLAVDARVLRTGARDHDRPDLRRGGARTVPAGAVDHLPADALQRLLAPRGRHHGPRGPCGIAAVRFGDDLALLAARAPAGDPRGLGRVGTMVRRRRGDAHLVPRPRVLPVVASGQLVGDGRGCRPGRGGARAVVRRGPPGREGRVLHPIRLPVPPRDRRLLPDPLRPGPRSRRSDLDPAGRVGDRADPPRGGRRAAQDRPGSSVARLRRLARELRHGPGRPRVTDGGAARALVVRPGPGPDPPAGPPTDGPDLLRGRGGRRRIAGIGAGRGTGPPRRACRGTRPRRSRSGRS
jgi:hypothetical protein